MRNRLLGVSLAVIVGCLPATASAADYARTLAFEKTAAMLRTAIEAGSSSDEIWAKAAPLGITRGEVGRQVKVPALTAPQLSLVSIDLVLAQLALQAGANYHVALRQAQARPEVLMIEGGVTDLAALAQAVAAAGFTDAFSKTREGYVAHLPIAVWTGATLVIEPGQTLLLDRNSGAFVVAAGTLAGTYGSIGVTGEPNPRLNGFNPFVVSALSGDMQFDGMRFAQLGYGDVAPLTGVTVVEGGFYRPGSASTIRNSRFEGVGSLTFLAAIDALAENNVFATSPGSAIAINGGEGNTARGNIVLASDGGHGIKVTGAARGARVEHNLILGAGLNGIFADEGALDLSVEANLVAGSKRSGISVASADCVSVTANLMLQNAQSGLAISDSAGLRVAGNRLIDNGNAGISITQQPDYGLIEIAGNALDGNRVGIKGSTTAELRFAANDFTGQAPRLLDGELVQFTDRFLDLRALGQTTVIDGLQLKSAAKVAPGGALRPTSCTFDGDA